MRASARTMGAVLIGLGLLAGTAGAQETGAQDLGASLADDMTGQGRVILGWGRMFDNDALGDGHDRWHTGAYTFSLIQGRNFSGPLPEAFGDVLEWRLHTEIAAAANLAHPAPGDQRYAGELSFGLHTQWRWQGLEMEAGGDLVGIGPMTGVSRVQRWIHRVFDMPAPNTSDQIENRLVPQLSAEIGRSLDLGGLVARPFVAGQAGAETLLRAGLDVTFGAFGTDAVMVRDGVTGQRYRAAPSALVPGVSFVAGGDVARVWASALLPQDGPAPTASRKRLRAGLHVQGQRASAFYGLTWLGPEFQGQGSGQTLGSLSFNLRF